MKTPEEKAETLRQQVNAKVIWGASDREVLDWLQERHGITDIAAHELLSGAYQAKRAAVRSKAPLYLVFSIPGMLLALLFVVLQSMGRFIVVGYGSLLVFFRSLFRLLTGHTQGSVH